MRYLPAFALWPVLAGCGPSVILDSAGGETESGTGSTTANGTGGETGTDVDGSTVSSATSPVTSAGPTTSPSGPEVTTAEGSTGFMGNDFPPEPQDCWQVQPIFETPTQTIVIPADQNGDGVPEIWVQSVSGGPGEFSNIFALDDNGNVLVEVSLEGVLRSLVDVDGDGLLELNLFTFGNGPPDRAYLPSNGSLSFELAPLPFDLPFNFGGLGGFFDLTLDGLGDVIELLQDEEQLQLLLGDGAGSFTPAGVLPIRAEEGIEVSRVEQTSVQTVVHSQQQFAGGQQLDCTPRNYYLVQVTETGELISLGEAPTTGTNQLGQLYRAQLPPQQSTADIFVNRCEPESQTHDVRRLSPDPGFSSLIETALVVDKAWAGVFDYDGDGVLDIIYADEPEGEIFVDDREVDGTVGTFSTGLEGGIVVENRTIAGDFDGDGREELLRGVQQGDTDTLVYERVFFGPCP